MPQFKFLGVLCFAVWATACATINPSMDYRSDVAYHPVDEVVVGVEVESREGVLGAAEVDGFEAALMADFAANGPFGVSGSPEAVVRVTVVEHAVAPPSGWGHLAWFFYPWPLLGGALERTVLEMTVEADVVRPEDGQVVYSTTVRSVQVEYTGLYDQVVTYEALARDLGEQLRFRLSANRRRIIAALRGEAAATELGGGPPQAIEREPEPMGLGGFLVAGGVGWPGTMTLAVGLGLSERVRFMVEGGVFAAPSLLVSTGSAHFQQALFCGVGVCSYVSLSGAVVYAEEFVIDDVGSESPGSYEAPEPYLGWGVGPQLGVEYQPFDHGFRVALEGGALIGDWGEAGLIDERITPSLTLRMGYSWD